MKVFEGIKFLEKATSIEECKEGHSTAQKFFFSKDEKRYFIKIKDNQIRDNLEEELNKFQIKHAKIEKIGKNSSGQGYIIEEFIDGENIYQAFNKNSVKGIYQFGFKIGEQYSAFRKEYKDKVVDEKKVLEFENNVNEILAGLDNMHESFGKLSDKAKDKIFFLKSYLKNNIKAVKNSLMIYGCVDFKPKNFMFNNEKEIVSVDFEDLGYNEVSRSIRWGIFTFDTELIEKYFSFTSGYLEGLFQFDVPTCVLDAINVLYAYMALRKIQSKIERQHFDEVESYLNKIDYLFENGNLDLSNRLINFNVQDVEILKDGHFQVLSGSFDDSNKVFKCSKQEKAYFLKLKNCDESKLNYYIRLYSKIEKAGMSTPKFHQGGMFRNDKMFLIFDYIDGKEWDKFHDKNDFDIGIKFGKKLAKVLSKLGDKESEIFKQVDIEKIETETLRYIDELYSNQKQIENFVAIDKNEMIKLVKKLAKSFKDEPLNIIHADIKFGNIMSINGENFYLVDNENYCYSYQVNNFRWNMDIYFKKGATKLYQGFLKGYLQGIYGLNLPKTLDGQIKLMILNCYITRAKHFAQKRSAGYVFDEHKHLFEDGFYNKPIDWLFGNKK